MSILPRPLLAGMGMVLVLGLAACTSGAGDDGWGGARPGGEGPILPEAEKGGGACLYAQPDARSLLRPHLCPALGSGGTPHAALRPGAAHR